MKKKLELPDVTLLAATSVEINETQLSLRISAQNIKFGNIKFLSSSEPKKKYPDIQYITIPHMKISDYSRLIIKDLHKYFETSHCLVIQSDSFVVNSELWKNDFLKYDYIGAPWPNEIKINSNLVLDMKKNPVGNGGFSLRSRKLAKVTSEINFDTLNFPIKSEDLVICHYMYEKMIDKGIIFAPPETAAKFSIENINKLYGQDVNSVFGFHGKHLREFFLKQYVQRSLIGQW